MHGLERMGSISWPAWEVFGDLSGSKKVWVLLLRPPWFTCQGVSGSSWTETLQRS